MLSMSYIKQFFWFGPYLLCNLLLYTNDVTQTISNP